MFNFKISRKSLTRFCKFISIMIMEIFLNEKIVMVLDNGLVPSREQAII